MYTCNGMGCVSFKTYVIVVLSVLFTRTYNISNNILRVTPPPGDSTLLFQNQPRNSGRIPMVQGGGCRPSAAPRTPARAPRATRAYIWRAFPPETSGPATRPRRGLAPRRPGGWERLFLCERQRFAPSNRPSLLTQPMRVGLYLGALASCAVRERQVGPSRCEAQGCAADGTADGPELWRAATSASMWE